MPPYSENFSEIGSTTACRGESHSGKAPPVCSTRMPMKRSSEPSMARWMSTGWRLRAVRVGVLEREALGELVVELHRAELPRAPQEVLHLEVDLGRVEGALARVRRERDAVLLEHAPQRRLRALPGLGGAHRLRRTRRQLDRDLAEAEHLVDLADAADHAHHLGLDLVLGAEDVGVVLAERAHAREAGDDAAALGAVQAPEVGEAQRQVAVRAQPASRRSGRRPGSSSA